MSEPTLKRFVLDCDGLLTPLEIDPNAIEAIARFEVWAWNVLGELNAVRNYLIRTQLKNEKEQLPEGVTSLKVRRTKAETLALLDQLREVLEGGDE